MLVDLRTLRESSRETAWAHARAAGWSRTAFLRRYDESTAFAKASTDETLEAAIYTLRGPWDDVSWVANHRNTLAEVAELMLSYHTSNVELRARKMTD